MFLRTRSTTYALFALMTTLGAIAFAYSPQHTPKDKMEATTCLSNMRQLGLAMMMYTQDYDNTLPPLKDNVHVQKLLFPYLKNKSLFTCPTTKTAYQVNSALTSKKTRKGQGIRLATILNPAQTVIFYETKPHADGQRSIGYLDGHAKREARLPSLDKH